jgi:hypothetical protein
MTPRRPIAPTYQKRKSFAQTTCGRLLLDHRVDRIVEPGGQSQRSPCWSPSPKPLLWFERLGDPGCHPVSEVRLNPGTVPQR